MRKHLLYALALASALPAARADDFKIVDCDAAAAAEIAAAYRLVADNKSRIFDAMTYLTSKQRQEMKEKWGRLTAACIDDRRTCAKDSGKGGHAHGGIGNRINICYYNHVSAGLSRCDLVNTLVHEEAHANGMPTMKGHNDATPAVKANDLVYRMGDDAQAFCEGRPAAASFDTGLRGRADLGLAAACSKDDQCRSGKRERGECVCKDDGDCPGSQKCRKPLFGINQCRP